MSSSQSEQSEASFSVDPHQANLQPNLLLLGSCLRFNPTPTFLGVTFDRTLSFSKHVSSLKTKFFLRLKALLCIAASSWGPLRSPSLFCINLFFSPYSLMLHRDGFLSQVLPIPPNLNASTKQPVAPSLTSFRPPLCHFFSPKLLYLPYKSPWLISLFRLMSRPFVSQPPFLFKVWPDLE